jgi:hypothetical protein
MMTLGGSGRDYEFRVNHPFAGARRDFVRHLVRPFLSNLLATQKPWASPGLRWNLKGGAAFRRLELLPNLRCFKKNLAPQVASANT